MATEFPLVINGRWREGLTKAGENVLNPATEECIGTIAHASAADLDEALDAAVCGLREWQNIAPWQRGEILKNAANRLRADVDVIARNLTREQGKPLAESKGEIAYAASESRGDSLCRVSRMGR